MIFTGAIIYKIVLNETNSKILGFLISLLCSVNSYNIKIHSFGFEFALFTFLLFLNLYIFIYKDNLNVIDLLLPNLLILTRIEGIVIYPLVIYRLIHNYKININKIYYYILPFILLIFYIFFSLYYYNQILPQSIVSKKAYNVIFPVISLDKNLFENFHQRLNIVKEFLGSMLFPILRLGTEPYTFYTYKLDINKAGNFLLNSNQKLLNYFLLLNIIILIYYYKKKKIMNLYLFVYIYFYFFFVLYTIRVESWYLPPLITSYLLFYTLGTYFLSKLIIDFIKDKIYFKYLDKFIIITTSIFVIIFIGKNYYLVNQKKFPFDEYRGIIYSPGMRDKVEIERYLAYKDAVKILQKNQISGEIASPEIGVLGFIITKEIYLIYLVYVLKM